MKKPLAGDKAFMKRYRKLLDDIKARIQQAQNQAVMSANAEMIRMYWDIGHMVAYKQEGEGWGSAVIPRLSADLRNGLPDTKGFSERNINRMIAFFRSSPGMDEIFPQAVAKNRPTDAMSSLLMLVPKIPWGHNILLIGQTNPTFTLPAAN